MSRCAFCRTFTIDQERHCLEFHPNLASLKKSAEDGCDFCLLCWTGFQRDWTIAQIELVLEGKQREDVPLVDPSIWIYIHFRDYTPELSQPQIHLACGILDPITGKNLSNFGVNQIDLVVYGTEGTPTGDRIPARICTAEQESIPQVTLIQQFIKNCKGSHEMCELEETCDMPTRVIDVGDPSATELPRLVTTDPGMQEPYIALSYCWGPLVGTYTLNHKTMDDMLRGIDETVLVAAHRDTFALARLLGIRFVWIDALCIIQGDADDWGRESRLMAKVYGNATLTVVVGRTNDARNPFLINDYKHPVPYCEIPLHEAQLGSAIVGFRRSTDYGAVETRGWCLQEKNLSRRMVIFGKEQMFFACRRDEYSEDRYLEKETKFSLHAQLAMTDANPWLKKNRLLKEWDATVVNYSKRKLSNPHDIFAAIASVAEALSKAMESRYFAGLWECDLIRNLLWMPGHIVSPRYYEPATRPQPTQFAPAPVIRAPSWSWAAIQGGVYPMSLQAFKSNVVMAKYKLRDDFIQVKSITENPNRWSSDNLCDSNVLHIPSRELQLIGRIVETTVLATTPTSDVIAALKKQSRIPLGMFRHGQLLGWKGTDQEIVGTDLSHFMGLGTFDIVEESVEEVWCLQLTATQGMMLKLEDDGKFSRLGLFQFFNLNPLDHIAEVEVRLV